MSHYDAIELAWAISSCCTACTRSACSKASSFQARLLRVESHFDKTAGLCVLNGRGHCCGVLTDPWPRRGHQHHDAETHLAEFLLMPKILVRRDHNFIAVEDGDREDVAVGEVAEAWSSRLAAANSSTASTCSRVTPGNHSTN